MTPSLTKGSNTVAKPYGLNVQFKGKNPLHLYCYQQTKPICRENPQNCLFEANAEQDIKWFPVNSFTARHLCCFQVGDLHWVAHIDYNIGSNRTY